MRSATLKPKHRDGRVSPWCVNVPPELSPTGKRQELFFATKAEAQVACEQLKARRENFGISLTAMTPGRIAEAAEAYKLLDPLELSLLDAARNYVAFHKARAASKPWGKVYAEYLAMPKKRSAKYEKDLKQAGETMRPFDEKLVIEISARDLEKALSGLALSTRNLKMRMLRAVFNFGIKRGYVTANPIDQMDFAEFESGEVKVFTPHQTEALLTYALENDLQLLPWLALALFCGIRPSGELAKLAWSCVHLVGKAEVEIPANVSKTHRRRFVDLSENAVAWLEAYRQRGGVMEGLVTPYQKENLRNHRRAAQKAAGINKWIQQGMRHTYCSAFLAARRGGVNELVLQSGHTDPDTMWRSYHRGMSQSEAQKFWNIRPPAGDSKILPFQAIAITARHTG